jgi:hypothetical protein
MTDSNLHKGYEAAYQSALARFARAVPAALALRSDTVYAEELTALRVPYLGQTYTLQWPSGAVAREGSPEEVSLPVRVLLLNYLLDAVPRTATGELIAFREIPGAATYEPSFHKRAVNPLVRTFDGKPDLLYAAAERLGGTRAATGDAAVTLPVLPLLPVTYAVWHGDEEFPAGGAVLFDASARTMLSIECLVVAASNGVYALMGVARTLKG